MNRRGAIHARLYPDVHGAPDDALWQPAMSRWTTEPCPSRLTTTSPTLATYVARAHPPAPRPLLDHHHDPYRHLNGGHLATAIDPAFPLDNDPDHEDPQAA